MNPFSGTHATGGTRGPVLLSARNLRRTSRAGAGPPQRGMPCRFPLVTESTPLKPFAGKQSVGQKSSKTKRRSRRKVDKIRELRGVMAAHGIARGQFATTSRFTEEAIAFAKDNSINLLDVDGLLSLIKSRSAEQQQALLNVALEGEYWRPTCVNCGVKLVARQPKQGGKPFWGCAGYPACRTTMVMSSAAAACAGVAGARGV